MKKCNKCKNLKEFSSFSKDQYQKDGFQRRCKVCQRQYAKQHYHKNSSTYLNSSNRRRKQIKDFIRDAKNRACADCGEIYPYWIMQFDHIDNKCFSISQSSNRFSINNIKNEIKKCEVVCSNCHYDRSYKRRSVKISKYHSQRAKYVRELKANSPCVDCKLNFDPWILHFDHVSGIKKFKIAAGVHSKGIEAIKEEIEKCEIVCGNCHYDRTFKRKIKAGLIG
jgi:hypothetical protein